MISYDEPADIYHENEAIGSTDLRNYIKSPRLFRDILDGEETKETEALLFGLASHLALLEPKRFAECVALKPKGMSFATVEGKAWRARYGTGKIIVTDDDARHLTGMHARMPAEVRAIFAALRTEVTVRTEMNDLQVQARFDLFGPKCWDLKSIDDIANVERAIPKRGYHIQKRFYQRVLAAELKSTLVPMGFIFAEKVPPYRWRIVELDADYDAIADEAIDKALHEILARTKSGCWDDPRALHLIASPPEWMHGEFSETDEGISF